MLTIRVKGANMSERKQKRWRLRRSCAPLVWSPSSGRGDSLLADRRHVSVDAATSASRTPRAASVAVATWLLTSGDVGVGRRRLAALCGDPRLRSHDLFGTTFDNQDVGAEVKVCSSLRPCSWRPPCRSRSAVAAALLRTNVARSNLRSRWKASSCSKEVRARPEPTSRRGRVPDPNRVAQDLFDALPDRYDLLAEVLSFVASEGLAA